MKIAIVANGHINDHQLVAEEILQNYQEVIAADGGINHCAVMGITPSVVIGDFDSASEEALQIFRNIKKIEYPTDKDHTDLELAVEFALRPEVTSITLYGALGGRNDHALNNLHLMRRYPELLRIESEEESWFVINCKKTFPVTPGQLISLLPIGGKALGVSSNGLKWELDQANLNRSILSLSNVCLSDVVTIDIKEGDFLCCLHK